MGNRDATGRARRRADRGARGRLQGQARRSRRHGGRRARATPPSPPARAPSPRARSTPSRSPRRRSRGHAAHAPAAAQGGRRAAARRSSAAPPPSSPAAERTARSSSAPSRARPANNAWKALSGRFAYLAPLSHAVIDRRRSAASTFYRLRASGPGRRRHLRPAAGRRRELRDAGRTEDGMQPAIYGLAGDAAERRRARLLPRRRSGRLHPVQAQLRRPRAAAGADRRASRDLHGRDDLPILIDQEGGRVARMQPPAWPAFPDGRALRRALPDRADERDRGGPRQCPGDRASCCARSASTSIACPCSTCGSRAPTTSSATARSAPSRCRSPRSAARCSTGCAPAAWSASSSICPAMAARWSTAITSCRSSMRSEEALEIDLEPFVTLRDAPMGMTAHVVYTAWDAERPASLSPIVIEAIIRGRIGFDGLLDVRRSRHAGACPASFGERARGVIAAGCDVALHCSGRDGRNGRSVADGVRADERKGDGTAGARDGQRGGSATGALPMKSWQRSATPARLCLSYAPLSFRSSVATSGGYCASTRSRCVRAGSSRRGSWSRFGLSFEPSQPSSLVPAIGDSRFTTMTGADIRTTALSGECDDLDALALPQRLAPARPLIIRKWSSGWSLAIRAAIVWSVSPGPAVTTRMLAA